MKVTTEWLVDEPAKQDSIPTKPKGNADRAEWVDYCVALGADRHYLNHATRHAVGSEQVEVHGQADIDDLQSLAASLGG